MSIRWVGLLAVGSFLTLFLSTAGTGELSQPEVKDPLAQAIERFQQDTDRALATRSPEEARVWFLRHFRLAPRKLDDLLNQKLTYGEVAVVVILDRLSHAGSNRILTMWANHRKDWADIARELNVDPTRILALGP